MSKLIYAQTSTIMEDAYQSIKNQDQTVNSVYFSVAFTGDGYLYTHGKKFRLFQVDGGNLSGIDFSVTNGIASLSIDGQTVGSGSVVQSIVGDSIINAVTDGGVTTFTHKANFNESATYGGNLRIPILTIDACGHITSASQSGTIDVTQVKANIIENNENYYLTAVNGQNLQNPVYNSSIYLDKLGNLYATNFYLNGQQLSSIFAPINHVSAKATDSVWGHVTLSDLYTDDNDVSKSIAATPKAVNSAVNAARQYANSLVAAQDSMIFAGTITHQGIIKAHNENVITATNDVTSMKDTPYKVGWTFRFTSAGTFEGEEVEVGDMIIAIRDKQENFSIDDWTVIQTNINGALTATSLPNGILYTHNSRNVSSLAFGNGILKSDGANISFVNPNTIWRNILVKGVSIGTNQFNILAGSNVLLNAVDGELTIGIDTSNIVGASASLTFKQEQTEFIYHPSTASILNIGYGLALNQENDVYTLEHSTFNAITSKLGSITTDGYGHVTSITEVTSLKNPYKLNIKNNAGTTVLEYDGSAQKVLKIVNGTDITLGLAANAQDEMVLTPVITHKYRPIQFLPTYNDQIATPLLQTDSDTVLTLVGGDNVELANSDSNGDPLPNGTLLIHAEDTWRNVEAYKFQSNVMSRSSIGNTTLKFSSDFLYSSEEIGLCWTEIDANGRITYVK